mmetsp:Transcript_1270/g.3226  ORF Transcript_1270/g.3226 Transcript_1270/m.3226 type:complete len:375 (-) Transcript_1270:15-1139(-)
MWWSRARGAARPPGAPRGFGNTGMVDPGVVDGVVFLDLVDGLVVEGLVVDVDFVPAVGDVVGVAIVADVFDDGLVDAEEFLAEGVEVVDVIRADLGDVRQGVRHLVVFREKKGLFHEMGIGEEPELATAEVVDGDFGDGFVVGLGPGDVVHHPLVAAEGELEDARAESIDGIADDGEGRRHVPIPGVAFLELVAKDPGFLGLAAAARKVVPGFGAAGPDHLLRRRAGGFVDVDEGDAPGPADADFVVLAVVDQLATQIFVVPAILTAHVRRVDDFLESLGPRLHLPEPLLEVKGPRRRPHVVGAADCRRHDDDARQSSAHARAAADSSDHIVARRRGGHGPAVVAPLRSQRPRTLRRRVGPTRGAPALVRCYSA